MLLFARFLSLAFSALLPLINPVGSALVFFGMVGGAPPEVYRRLARKIALTTIIFLLIVDVSGAAVLTFFSISLPVVQLAGGLVVVAIGWRLLNEERAETRENMVTPGYDPRSLDEKVFYPFSFPITAGPGTLAVAITLSAHATQKTLLTTLLAHAGILAAIILNCIAVYFSYAYAPRLTARISRQTIHGILRVIAFILLCIGGADCMERNAATDPERHQALVEGSGSRLAIECQARIRALSPSVVNGQLRKIHHAGVTMQPNNRILLFEQVMEAGFYRFLRFESC